MILTITIRCTTRRYGASSKVSGHFDSDLKNPPGGDVHDSLQQQRRRKRRPGNGSARTAELKRRTPPATKAVRAPAAAESLYPGQGEPLPITAASAATRLPLAAASSLGPGQRCQPVAPLPAITPPARWNSDETRNRLDVDAIAAAAEMRRRRVARRGRRRILNRPRLRTSRRMPGRSENRSPSSAR
jgi:hypothetical protein